MLIHFLVTGNDFPYQYYLAVKTAQKTQKTKVKIWLMEDGVKDTKYLDLLDVEIGYLPKLNVKCFEGKDEQFICSHTKDYYMWKILREFGGFYFDLDMVFLKDITSLLDDKEILLCKIEEKDGNWASWGAHAVGAQKDSIIMKRIFESCEKILENSQIKWNTLGPEISAKIIRENSDKVFSVSYPIGCGISGPKLDYIYQPGEFSPNVRIIHLYGQAGRFVSGENRFEKIDPEFVRKSDSRLANAIRSVLEENEYNPIFKELPYVHFICTGGDFSYQYYLAIKTAQKTQKAKIKIWLVDGVKGEYLDLLTDVEKGNIDLLNVPAFVNRDEHFIRSHTKDFRMWEILYKYGGFVFDFDTMSFKDITEDILDNEVLVCKQYDNDSDEAWMSGLVGAIKNSPIIHEILEDSIKSLQDPNMKWGTTGPKSVYKMVKSGAKVLTVKFPIGGGRSLLHPLFEEGNTDLAVNAKIVQLYAGAKLFCSTEDFYYRLTPEYVKTSNTRIAKAIKSILTETEYDPLKIISNKSKGEIVMQDKKKFRFHILGLCHLPCSKEYLSCAFTQKNYKLAKMLLSLGHEVYYYGSEGSDISCTEFIQTHTLSDICKEWGDGDNRFEIGYNWKETDFRHDFNTKKTETTLKFYKNCIDEINKRKKPDDFLLITQGSYHKPIADAVNLYLTCEPGIGYRGSYCRFRAFESSYIQNFTYGSAAPFQCINGSYYDRVIPNYFEEEDFEFSDKKEDYYLYIGRIIKRKGIQTAYLATQAIDAKLLIVGQGGKINSNGSLSGDAFTIPKGNWEYVGFADIEKRKKMMSKAIATFTPTEYLECFAGTHIESMLSGTPPITTNFGVFPGTIPDCVDGKIGFRCNTLDDFCKAALRAKEFKKEDYLAIRKYGERFLCNNVKNEYEKWFSDLYRVYLSATVPGEKGWSWIDKELIQQKT